MKFPLIFFSNFYGLFFFFARNKRERQERQNLKTFKMIGLLNTKVQNLLKVILIKLIISMMLILTFQHNCRVEAALTSEQYEI